MTNIPEVRWTFPKFALLVRARINEKHKFVGSAMLLEHRDISVARALAKSGMVKLSKPLGTREAAALTAPGRAVVDRAYLAVSQATPPSEVPT